MNKWFLRKFCVVIFTFASLLASGCGENGTDPAEPNGEEDTAKLQILSNFTNGCMFIYTGLERIVVTTATSSGIISTPSQTLLASDYKTAPGGGKYFEIKVPKYGYFTLDVQIYGNCDDCCKQYSRPIGSHIAGCPYPKQGKPFYKTATLTTKYYGAAYDLKPELSSCLCTCP